jgi:hypothetical protein
MSVPHDAIRVGAVFEFSGGVPRRVVKIHHPVGNGFTVEWEYADGKRRGGRLSGNKWSHYFRREARREIPDAWKMEEVVLKESQRRVTRYREPRRIALNTCCPDKWAFIDQETGHVWGHDGTNFRRMGPDELREIASLLAKRAEQAAEEQLQMGLG